jgi:hypothetical protein
MGGGLMQLVAYGAQDIYLTGNPQITFFKVVYRRHTNFSMEAIEQTFNGTAGYGNTVTATISRNGDLVHRMYLEHAFTPANEATDWANNFGHALIKSTEIEIGGQKIDKHYGRWMQIWSDLTEFNPTGASVTAPVGGPGQGTNDTLFNKMSGNGAGCDGASATNAENVIFVPLQFWFCRNPGLALPLIALQYHEVKVKMEFEAEANIHLGSTDHASTSFDLWADYIYLDTDERRRFAQVSHEYLIEQLQYQNEAYVTATDTTKNFSLNFNHPVKELIWQLSTTVHETTLAGGVEGDASTLAAGMDMTAGAFQLKLNGHDRFTERNFRYFTRAQVWQHHSGYGGTAAKDSIGVYSFALKPEEHQPSGTCNFSRIDNAQLAITTAVTTSDEASDTTPGGAVESTNLHIYAVNYNVLRIMSGMGGLAYSN